MKASRIILCLITALLFNVSDTLAQGMVRGKVIDARDKGPVISASVIEIDKDNRTVTGTVTDIDGNFALIIKNVNNRIKISSIGYNAFTSAIGNRKTFNVSLQMSSNQLETIVIQGAKSQNVGGMLNVSERHNTMATVTVNTKDLEELSAQSIDQALVGRMPGVDFGTTTGDPGAGMSIRIRGTASLSGNSQPLIILDNMPYETQIPSDFNFGNADEQSYANLLSIAPSDIKDITVLKDAASTALWGSRAANGVLVINTKRGSVGKPQIAFNFRGGLSRQPKTFPMLNGDEYGTLIQEMVRNRSGILMNLENNPEFAYDPFNPYYYYNYSQNTNWLGAITRTGITQQHDVNIKGGGERAQYYASVGYSNVKGTTVGTSLNTIKTRVNLDYQVSDKITFRSDFAYSHIDNTLNYTNPRGQAFIKMPNQSDYLYDDFGNITDVYFSPAENIQGEFPNYFNPLAMADAAVSRSTGDRLVPSFALQYRISPEVRTNFSVRFDINNSKSNNFLPQIVSGRPISDPIVNNAQDFDGDSYVTEGKFDISYTPKFKSEAHHLQLFTSLQAREKNDVRSNLQVANTASAFFQDPSNPGRYYGDETDLSGGVGLGRSVGAYFGSQYQLLDRYALNVGLRVDGNSGLSPKYRFSAFPSVSGKWHVADEPLIKKLNLKWMDDFAIRMSVGITGNRPDADYYNIFSPTSFLKTPLNASYSGSYAGQSAIVSSNLQITSLRVERVTGTNLGFNVNIFKNRIKIDAEVYKQVTRDMIVPGISLPSYSGFGSVDNNDGKMTNTGFELLLTTTPIKTKNWNVDFNFNFANNQNVINEISEYFPRDNGQRITRNGEYKTFLQLGNPFGSFYGFKTRGVFKDLESTMAKDASGNSIVDANGNPIYMRFNYPSTFYQFQPGDIEYVDVNHDGNINYMDQVYLGNGIPKISGGFGQTITYKGRLTLRTYFNYRAGFQIINAAKMGSIKMDGYDNQSTAVLRRWRNPGDITDIPRAGQGLFNYLGSDRFVEDASFVRMGQLTVSYSLPKSIIDRLRLDRLSAYITAENLFTLTKYTGQNPDISIMGNQDPFTYPQDKSNTPPTRNILFGLTAGF
ncbi:SusC/RagA family TonB-linked outer membrane protein [Pedobacter sp. P351]|uniref:SusC/RagA family TonB-linked outer membrane protein n=1 Tax=Pedobacter superstes TaxID=3133441 RepID=UPI0030A84D28